MQTPPRRPVLVDPDEVLMALARNARVPVPLLRRLLHHRGARDEAARWRSDLTQQLAEEIDALGHGEATHALACNPDLPVGMKRRLVRGDDASVRSALAGRDAPLPRDLVEAFVADRSAQVRQAAAANRRSPSDLRARLATDPDPAVRAALAQWWTEAPEEVRRTLLTDTDATVRAAACATYFRRLPHPVPPADLHPALLADPVTRAGVVAHLDLDPATAHRLAADEDPDVRGALAEHPELPADLVALLGRDEDPMVRVKVFLRKDTAESLREVIHAGLLAGSEKTKMDPFDADEEDVFCSIAMMELRIRIVVWVLEDPLPYVDSPYPAFRRSAAAAGDALPRTAIARLFEDPDSEVRKTMAAAVSVLDPDTAERLERAHEENRKWPGSPADNAVFPPETMRRFATDPDPRMRALALRDPELPAEFVERLARDDEARVRREAAAHPNLPAPSLLLLLGDTDLRTARAAAGSPHLPHEAMEAILAVAEL
ncbi:hypothetical protein OG818_39485 [Streptomyces virginiae]|uniref:hypothetical protein n=2 Tax=Streptomyces virginiae TaxID=1961 RepID=UPI00224F540D|nr:hypothetical protein [Streptomyces virginiae]MCX4721789.1 hypothetical protein [Streptomyces virginiae]